jgi:NitT/TauT family transport system ATP-binding protein
MSIDIGTGKVKVRISNVTKTFDTKVEGKSTALRVLNGISLDIYEGEFVAFTGRSGCGKTTALRIVMGLQQASSGTVEVDGKIVTKCGYDRGMVFQHADLLPWRTALENIEFGLEMKGVSKTERRARALQMLDLVGLKESAHRRPDQLSGGMKQRVGIARAFAIDPEVLLMDEPFGALDSQTRETMQVELSNVHKKTGKTIIFVTHDLEEALLLADRVVIFSPKGVIHEVVDINLPRSAAERMDLMGSDEYTRKRVHIWKTLKMINNPDGGDLPESDREAA